jgi:hypothetical protein
VRIFISVQFLIKKKKKNPTKLNIYIEPYLIKNWFKPTSFGLYFKEQKLAKLFYYFVVFWGIL